MAPGGNNRSRYIIHILHIMKKNINPFKEVFQIGAVLFGAWLLFVIFSALTQWSYDRSNKPQDAVQDQKELNEMRVYHSPKGLVEVDDGLVIIRLN